LNHPVDLDGSLFLEKLKPETFFRFLNFGNYTKPNKKKIPTWVLCLIPEIYMKYIPENTSTILFLY
jgi:hypothetical protein